MGLFVTLPAAGTFIFEFWIVFQSAAITRGIQLSCNGPAQSVLAYRVNTPTGTTGQVLSYRSTYNAGTTSAGIDAANVNRLAKMEGLVTATAAGNLIVRFATEIAGSAVTIKAGSAGRYRRVDAG